jgi:serine/threonine protein kinase
MIGQTILHYKILEKLGEGGMGVVYKAKDTRLERIVAIKFLPRHIATNAEERERFKIEAKAAAALNHPNIATIHAIEEVDEELFIVMEYIEGQELSKKVNSEQLSVNSIINIVTQIADGLQAAHEKGIIHRDIKPGNVMLTGKNLVKIMDFGLARMAGRTRLTKTGTTLGTVAYMSPEQAQGINADHRTDIWSLGVVLYEMITGHLPFEGEYEAALLYSIVHKEPQPLALHRKDAPEILQRIVNRALSKNAQDRYQAVSDLLAELQNVEQELEKQTSLQEDKATPVGGQAARKTLKRPSTKSVAERRQVTVMSCNLIVSSTRSEQLDPEDLHELLPASRHLCEKIIAAFWPTSDTPKPTKTIPTGVCMPALES